MSTNTPAHVCPKCASDRVERVPRNRALDRMAGFLGWRVYRCVDCDTRFYDRPAASKAS